MFFSFCKQMRKIPTFYAICTVIIITIEIKYFSNELTQQSPCDAIFSCMQARKLATIRCAGNTKCRIYVHGN